MKVPNLRDLDFSESDAKNVEDTKLLNTMARENPDTVKSDPGDNMKEHVVGHAPFGALGIKGRN